MSGENGAAGVLACMYCGAEAESKPPYAVVYCHCRSAEHGEASAEAAPLLLRAA